MEFEPVWGLPIIIYLFLAGLGGGAFLTSGLAARINPDAVVLRKAGRYIAPIVVAIGLVCLMFDAKAGALDPFKFALLLHNPFSVMTWGVVFLAIFEVIALIVAIMELRKVNVPKWLSLTGSLFGVCVGAYTGVLLGVVKTFPLWNNPVLPLLFLVSAISTGAAIVLLSALIKAPKEFEDAVLMKKMHFFLPITEIVLVVAMLFIVSFQGVAASESVGALLSGKFALTFWIGFIIVGLVGPTIIEVRSMFCKKVFANERTWSIVSECGVLIGGFLLRLLIVLAALPVVIVA
ncbi:MAG: polysulfide reductase NrfD [Eggerthellaceae bacterium]|jgi:formate-dependent nitrite reductase membrane component NrfD|nr:polysulfide reductase NrfD [Eggerthellaceae bacterium]MCH4220962.1 polysulfide reductase NrfD [Eggerthellaceae bacterium]